MEARREGDWVALALLGKTWGRRGELIAVSLTSGPERFDGLEHVYLFGAGDDGRRVELESVWEHRGQLVFKFRGIDSISDAEHLEGAEVRVPRAERAELPEGEYYQSDLVGCEVVERANGERLGTVTALQDSGGPLLLEVAGAAGAEPLLVPFARAICVEIDVAARRIVVDLPEGLKELNVR
ncbi:MAG: ribosome maturation factor RimM [Acidobacteriota bacterium]